MFIKDFDEYMDEYKDPFSTYGIIIRNIVTHYIIHLSFLKLIPAGNEFSLFGWSISLFFPIFM